MTTTHLNMNGNKTMTQHLHAAAVSSRWKKSKSWSAVATKGFDRVEFFPSVKLLSVWWPPSTSCWAVEALNFHFGRMVPFKWLFFYSTVSQLLKFNFLLKSLMCLQALLFHFDCDVSFAVWTRAGAANVSERKNTTSALVAGASIQILMISMDWCQILHYRTPLVYTHAHTHTVMDWELWPPSSCCPSSRETSLGRRRGNTKIARRFQFPDRTKVQQRVFQSVWNPYSPPSLLLPS